MDSRSIDSRRRHSAANAENVIMTADLSNRLVLLYVQIVKMAKPFQLYSMTLYS